MAEKNKVEFGLENVHIAPVVAITEEAIQYGEIIKMAGAVKFTQTPSNETTEIMADNTIYVTVTGKTTGEGTLGMVKFPDEFKKKILGYIEDRNKVLVEVADAQPKSFALMAEVMGDVEKRRIVYFLCTPKRIGDTYNTAGKTVGEVQDEITITIKPNPKGYYKASVSPKDSATPYNAFFTSVYNPSVEEA